MHHQVGFSLLEVLIVSALLATALLGLGALATRTLEDAAVTRDHLVAHLLLIDLDGRVALSGGVAAWRALEPGAAIEHRAWQALVENRLPYATTHLCDDTTPEDGHPTLDGCDGAGPLTAKLHFRTFLHQEAQRRVLELTP